MKTKPFAFAALLIACNSASSEPMPYCSEAIYEVGIHETTVLGFAAQDLLNLAATNKYIDWRWDYKPGATKLSMRAISTATKARYIESVAVYPDGSPDIALSCPSRVEVDVWLNFTTDDGGFNERWFGKLYDTDGSDCRQETGDLCFAPGTEANFNHHFNRDNLIGNFYKEVELTENLRVEFFAETKFRQDKNQANVSGKAYGCSQDVCYSYFIHGGQTFEGAYQAQQ